MPPVTNRHMKVIALFALILLFGGCGQVETATPIPPTVTQPVPTSTPIQPSPTLTPAPATATPVSPTATQGSPTDMPLLSTSTPSPSLEGSDGLIAFVSTRDGNGEIYVMNADGSSQRRLTNYRQWDGYPDWSPDGKQIAYYSYLSSKDWVIKVMDADGSNPRQLTDNGICDGAPYWSPDGTRIAYSSDGDCTARHREIYVMDADGSDQINLTQNDADESGSSWSPDSSQIAFSSNRDGNYELYVMDADGGNVRRLTENSADDYAPAWSPDGSQIAFFSERDGNAEIYLIDADGGNPRSLTNNPTEDWFPRWSPDGSQITFSSKRGGNLDIYVMDVDDAEWGAGNVRRLTDSPREDFNSVWQPEPLSAQPDTWVRSYPGDPRWAALDGLVTHDGGYLLVGASNYSHQNTHQEDITLVKTDAAGEIAWVRTYGGSDFDRGIAVVEAAGGGFVILGETASTGAGNWDMFLIQVDQDGNEVWSRTFGGPAQERANAIRPVAGGGYILVGQTASFGAAPSTPGAGVDLYLVRTDEQGDEIWSQTYGGEPNEEGYDVRQTPDGGFLVLGQVLQGETVYVNQEPDILLLKTDGTGEELWSQVWETEEADGGHVLLPASDGGYLIAGITTPAGNQSRIDILNCKIDAEGNQIWNKPLGDPDAVDYAADALELPGGGYLLTGLFNRSGRGAIPLIRTGADGEPVSTQYLAEGRGNKVGLRLVPTPDGGYLIVGQTDEFGRGFETILIKIDATEIAAPMPAATELSADDPTPSALGAISVDAAHQVELLFTLSGHSNRVIDLGFSGDGAYLASSSLDRTIKLWNVASGHEVHTFSMDKVGFNGIALSPDGRLLASADAIWDLESKQVVHTLVQARNVPGPVAFSPDGSTLAVALEDQPIMLWDVGTGQVVRTFEAQAAEVTFSLAFSPDGILLAAGVHGGKVRLWDVASGQIAGTLEYGRQEGDVHDVAFSPDGKLLASVGTDDPARVWDVASGEVMHNLRHGNGLYGVAFSLDGSMLATAVCDRTVKLWDVASGQLVRTLPHGDEVMSVVFSPDGSLLASGGYDNQVYLWGIRR